MWTLLQATTAASAADLASEAAAFSPKAAGFRGHVAVSQRRDSMMGGDPSEGEEGGVQRRAGTRAWRQGAFGKVRRERGGKVKDTGRRLPSSCLTRQLSLLERQNDIGLCDVCVGPQVLVDRVLGDFERRGDVQTLATIVCVLGVQHPASLLHVRLAAPLRLVGVNHSIWRA